MNECAAQRENLQDGRTMYHTWVSSLLVEISLGVSQWEVKMFFWTVCLRRSVGDLCYLQLSTHAWP